MNLSFVSRKPSIRIAAIIAVELALALLASATEVLHLDITRTNAGVRLSWTNSGVTLESTLTVTGAWLEVTGAPNPYLISATNAARFFRLRGTVTPPCIDCRYLAPTFTTAIGDPFGCGCVSPENPNSLAAGGSAQDNGGGAVLLHTGELTQDAVDLEIPGRGFNWRFERRYRSGMSYDGPMGQGWDFNYNQRLVAEAGGNMLRINGLGRVDRYTLNTNGTFDSPGGFYTRLIRNLDGTFTERDRHGSTNIYSSTNMLGIARLMRISDRNGNQMTFQYNPAGQLTNVIDTLSRNIAYAYDANGRLTNVTDFAARTLHFVYDGNGDLLSATSPTVSGTPTTNDFPSGKTTLYSYASGFGDPRFNHDLLSVTAPNEVAVGGPPRLVAQYDTNPASSNADRLVSLRLGGTNASNIGAGGTINYAYVSFGPAGSNDFASPVFQTTVTNRNGNRSEYRFNQLGDIVRAIQFTRGLRPGEPLGYTNTFAYNRDGEMTGRTNAELDTVIYTFDSAQPDRLQQGNLLQVLRLPGPRGGDQTQIVTSQTYETNFNFIASGADGRTNTTLNRYDSRGNRTNTVHPIPSIVEDFEYNAFGQMTAYVLPANGSAQRRRDVMSYYSSGPQTGYLQTQIVDSGGFNLTTTYEYDTVGNVSLGNLVRMVDPRGNDTLYTVNALNQVVRQFSRAVSTTSGLVRYQRDTIYDANNNVVRVDTENRDDTGAIVAGNPVFTTTHVYDILDDRLSSSQEVDVSANVVTAYAYDANQNSALTRFGEATAGRDPFNIVQTLFDERDLVFLETRAPGSSIQSTTQTDYDRNGNILRSIQGTESDPRTKSYTHDGFDRLVRTLDPMGNARTNHYDANDNLVSDRTDGELNDVPGSAGNVRLAETLYAYDAMDRLTNRTYQLFDPQTQASIGDGQAVIRFTYSANSQRLSSTDDNSNRTTYTYDTANRLLTVTDAKTNTVTAFYDANSNLRQKIAVDRSDVAGQTNETFSTLYVRDGLDRLIIQTDSGGNTTTYAYDSRNNLTVRTNAKGNVTLYQYDGLGRPVETDYLLTDTGDGSGTVTGGITNRLTWDDSGRLTSRIDGNNNATQYGYDSLNRLITVSFADGTTNSNVYDVHNNRVSTTDANGTTVIAAFDLLNRVMSNNVIPAPGVLGTTNETLRYDGLSRVVTAINGDSVVRNQYDSVSQLILQSQQVSGGASNVLAMTYDGEGNMTRLAYPGGRVIQSTFDALNRVKVSRDDPPGPGSTNAIYQYVGQNRVSRRDNGNGTRMDVAYDAVALVREIQHSASGSPFYGRRFVWDETHSLVQSSNLLGADSRSYHYDSAYRLDRTDDSTVFLPTIYGLDPVGNRTNVNQGPGAANYIMDPTLPTPADFQMNQYTIGPTNTSRSYDANGNLISANGHTFGYDFRDRLVQMDSGQIAYKYDCYGRRIEKNVSGSITRFVYASWDEIEEQDSFGTTLATFVWARGDLLQMNRSGQSYFYHGDHLGSIAYVTDGSGNIVESHVYDDYGTPSPNFSSIGNPYLFTSQRYDHETGWYYYRNRYFDPAAGRFVTRDPIGIWGDKCNIGNGYTYAGNNPTTFKDPVGLGSVPDEVEEEWPRDGDKGQRRTGNTRNCKKIKGSDREVCESTGLQWRLYVDFSLEGSITYKATASAGTPFSGIIPVEVKTAVEGALKGAAKGGSTYFFNFIRVQCWHTWKEKCDVEYEEARWIQTIKEVRDQKGLVIIEGKGMWWPLRKFWVSEEVTRYEDLGGRWELVKPEVKPKTKEPEHGPAGGD